MKKHNNLLPDETTKQTHQILKLVNTKRNALYYLKRRIKKFIFNRITSNSTRVFLRGGDRISLSTLLEGVWEIPLTNFIINFASKGYSDFFIDIGANIGLMSCQNGLFFKRVVCFEPNPLCNQILKVNLEISLESSVFTVNEYGLGSKSGTYNLYIPKHNWGAAFIDSDDNLYSKKLLFNKDGNKKYTPEKYSVQKVKIESANERFEKLFSELRSKGLTKGIIKIDVEGCEYSIIKGIAEQLPSDFSIVICFENLNNDFDFSLLAKQFTNTELKIFKLERTINYPKKANIVKLLYFAMGKSDENILVPITKVNSVIGDIILYLNSDK